MLGFVVPDRADASTSLDYTRESPDRGLDFDLTSLTSLSPSVSGGERWADWPTQRGLGGTSVSPDTGVGEYAGDGTIDPSVLGGGGGEISPSKMDGYSSSPAGRRADLSRAMEEDYRMDDEEEEDVIGLLFATNGSDEEFVPPSGMGKGKGKSRAVPMDSVVDSPESVGASSSSRAQRTRRRKPFPDEAETEYRNKHDDNDDDHESDESDSRTRAISAPAPVLLYARPKKRRRTTTTPSSSSSRWSFCHHCRCKSRRPKMRCSVIVASTSERCRKLYCDGCIEKRYAVQLLQH